MSIYSPPYNSTSTFNPNNGSNKITTSSTANNMLYDAFGRLRVSDTGNRFDVEFTLDKQPLLMDEYISNNGTITHNTTTRDVTLAIAETTSNTNVVFSAGYDVPYTPGNSQLIDITGTLDAAGIGGGTASVFLRNNGVDETYDQADWENSSYADTVDWSYSQIFSIDFQSLKVGRIRFYLVRQGKPYMIHYIINDNKRVSGYWQRPSLRPYWRIYNNTTNTICEIGYGTPSNGVGFRYTLASKNASATMRAICATVKSEGGYSIYDLKGFSFACSNYSTSKTVGATLTPLLSIRVQTTFNGLENRTAIMPELITIMTDNPMCYRVLLNPTLTDASFVAVDSNSSVYKDVSATAVSGGTILDEDYASSTANKSYPKSSITGRIVLSTNWNATSGDIITIAGIRTGTTNATTYARILWSEIR